MAAFVLSTAIAGCSQSGGKADSTTASTTTTIKSSRSSTTTTAPEAAPVGNLDWHTCDGGFQCSTLKVPVDYSKPDGPTLDLAIVRRPARDQANRIGSLLVNPGGPGASAIDLAENLQLPSAIRARFDLVGFDPRGVGRSSPLDCHSHLQEIYDADPTMEDQADIDHYLAVSKAFVDECATKYADLLPHLGTVDVAKDMDRVRAALGDEKLTYLGYSYGTSIGQQYARLFPTKVRAMLLDGIVDESQSGLDGAAGQAQGFNSALNAFIADCDKSGCGINGEAGATIDSIIAASERSPIPASGADRPASPGDVALAMGQALYAQFLWPRLGRALNDAQSGNATGLMNLADDYLQRNADGSYPNGFEIYFAVSCLDSVWPKDPKAVLDRAKQVGAQYPRVGEALVNDYVRCALWPTPPQPLQPIPANITGLAPIVLVSTTNDPATPYESGVRVAKSIPGARLVTNVGEGHTVVAEGKPCIDDMASAYLVDLKAPTNGLRCD